MTENMKFNCMYSVIAFFLNFFAGNVVIVSSNVCMFTYVLLSCALFLRLKGTAGDLLFQSNPILFVR